MLARPLLCSALVAGFTLAGAPKAFANECDPSRMMLILDKSSSMRTSSIDGVTLWDIATGALDTVVSEFEDSIDIGLTMFPQPNECSPGTSVVDPGPGNRDAIIDALGDPPPTSGNWTPMAQTLEAAAVEPSLTSPGSPAYAVLVTDGWQWCSPYDPSTRFDPVDAVGDLNGASIKTFVVGFGGAVDALTLNMMAVEAGTARPGCDPSGDSPDSPNPCYYQADDPEELIAALTDISVDVSTEICDGLDNDCDGEVDEGLTEECATDCGSGVQVCVNGDWTGCDAPQPEEEICDGVDNSCDGVVDPGCDCTVGDTRPCGETETTGACTPGVQTCSADGTWGDCEGSVGPGSEMCDGIDNDCDGEVDEMNDDVGSLCGPGFVCVDGGCDPVDPVDPPDDENDDPNPAADDGAMAAGCACQGASDPGSAAGMMLLLAAAGILLSRRRRSR